jgi:hypothetical protein
MHKTQGFLSWFRSNVKQAGGSATPPVGQNYSSNINGLVKCRPAAPALVQCWYAKNRNFVMSSLTKTPSLNEAIPKPDSKAGSQSGWE